MTDKEKIRQEIERRREKYRTSRDFIDAIRCTICTEILSFIDSLPEEKEPIREYVSSEDSTLGKLLKEMKDFSPQEDLGISNEEYNDVVNELIFGKEKSVSENLEEAANDYAHDLVHDDVFENFIAGAQWQKEQMITKACEWLEENLAKETSVIGNGNVTIKFRGAIEAFKKAMEE